MYLSKTCWNFSIIAAFFSMILLACNSSKNMKQAVENLSTVEKRFSKINTTSGVRDVRLHAGEKGTWNFRVRFPGQQESGL